MRLQICQPEPNQVLLTFVGGGVFGNLPEWLDDAIATACHSAQFSGLQVKLVYYKNVSQSRAKRIEAILQQKQQEHV